MPHNYMNYTHTTLNSGRTTKII